MSTSTSAKGLGARELTVVDLSDIRSARLEVWVLVVLEEILDEALTHNRKVPNRKVKGTSEIFPYGLPGICWFPWYWSPIPARHGPPVERCCSLPPMGPKAQTGQVVCHPRLLLIAKRCKNILRLCVWASLVASSVELGRSVARSMAQTNTTQQKAERP